MTRRAEQPIRTAPKDGTEMLAYFPQDAGWLRVKFGYYGWELSPDGGTEFSYEIAGDPTHWMPLPEPPHIIVEDAPDA